MGSMQEVFNAELRRLQEREPKLVGMLRSVTDLLEEVTKHADIDDGLRSCIAEEVALANGLTGDRPPPERPTQRERAIFNAGFRHGVAWEALGERTESAALAKAKRRYFKLEKPKRPPSVCRKCGSGTTHKRADAHGLCLKCEQGVIREG